MPIIYDISRVKDDPWYKEGYEEGYKEGFKIGFAEGQEQLLVKLIAHMLNTKLLSVEKIASITNTEIKYVRTIKADLNKS